MRVPRTKAEGRFWDWVWCTVLKQEAPPSKVLPPVPYAGPIHDAETGAQAGPIPGFSQGTPEPPELPRHTYGAQGTIQQTGTINIQVHKGQVVGVWFRCLNLPFTVSEVEKAEPVNPSGSIAVETITFVDREGSSQ